MTKQSDSPDHGRALFPGNDTARIARSLRPAVTGDDPDDCKFRTITAHAVEQVIRARALRSAHVPPELLGDPAWDMLLELLHASLTSRCVTAAVLCKAGGVRIQVGRRWIDALERQGLCIRSVAEGDRDIVRLSDRGGEALGAYFNELVAPSPETPDP